MTDTRELPPMDRTPCPHNPNVCECDLVGMEDQCTIQPTKKDWLAEHSFLAQRERQLSEALRERDAWREVAAEKILERDKAREALRMIFAVSTGEEQVADDNLGGLIWISNYAHKFLTPPMKGRPE